MSHTFYLLQPSAPDAAPAPAPTGSAPAGDAGSPFGGLSSLIWLLPIVFVFFMMRNQSKKQKEVEQNLKPGDRVWTRGGVIGKIVKVAERHIDIEVAPGVFVAFRKESVEGVEVDPKKEADKKDDAKKDDAKAKDDKKDEAKSKPKDEAKAKEASKEKA